MQLKNRSVFGVATVSRINNSNTRSIIERCRRVAIELRSEQHEVRNAADVPAASVSSSIRRFAQFVVSLH